MSKHSVKIMELFNFATEKLISTEIKKGELTSWISIIIATFLNYISTTYYGVDIFKSTFVTVMIFGNLLNYILDLMFAKETFSLSKYNGINNFNGKVPYSDYKTRTKFIFSSFFSKIFMKFIIINIITIIINLSILKFLIIFSEKFKFLNNWKHRNILFASITSMFTFNLFINELRFLWVYDQNDSNFEFNTLMYIWFTLILLIVVGIESDMTKLNKLNNSNQQPTKINEPLL